MIHNFLYLQVWPDYPNVTVNESLDWDTQVEVQYFLYSLLLTHYFPIFRYITYYICKMHEIFETWLGC